MRELLFMGGSKREVADKFGVSTSTITKWLRRHKLLPFLPVVVHESAFTLEHDPRRGELYERRRSSCARLRRCEDEWIALYGARQGRCPAACAGVAKLKATP